MVRNDFREYNFKKDYTWPFASGEVTFTSGWIILIDMQMTLSRFKNPVSGKLDTRQVTTVDLEKLLKDGTIERVIE